MNEVYRTAIPRFYPEVERLLLVAGWYPGRREISLVENWAKELYLSGGIVMPDSGRRALEEFGGIEVSGWAPGQEIARSPFRLVPTGLGSESGEFVQYAKLAGTGTLCPIGDIGDGHGDLAIDEKGRVYMVFSGEVSLVGDTIEEALTALLLGLATKVVTVSGDSDE